MAEVEGGKVAAVKIAAPAAAAPIDRGRLDALRAQLNGSALLPADPGFAQARAVWNGMIQRSPALIVRCGGTADVLAAVRFARELGLPVSVRSGGHNVSGSAVCNGGVVVDLGGMRSVRVDPERRRVRAEGGARLGDLDREAQAFGLAVPVGVVSKTGIGGLALHGGMGFLSRKLGLTSDNLLSADVVTADGRLVVASRDSHPDLLWALQGGGGNFGIVTSFEFRAYPVGPEVWMGLTFYPAAEAETVMRRFREVMANAPDELMAIAIYWSAPHGEPIPEDRQGEPVLVIAACYSGPLELGEAALRPLRQAATPIADASGRMPYLAAQQLFDPEYPDGRRYYWKSIYIDDLRDEVVQLLGDYAARRPSPITSLDVWALGGALNRVSPAATAFAERRAPYLVGIESNWDDPDQDAANIAWSRELFRALEKFSSGGTYLNFPGFAEEGEELTRRSYGGNYARLQEIKAGYDPENVFGYSVIIRKTSGGADPGARTPEHVREFHRRGVEATNRRDAAAVAALYATDAVVHDPFYPEPLRGRAAVQADYEAFFRAFPDLRVRDRNLFVAGDRIAYELDLTATNSGPLATPAGDIPPTGRPIVLKFGVFAQLDEAGLVREQYRHYDVAGLTRQLGLGSW